jgi:serine/threonine protein kinase
MMVMDYAENGNLRNYLNKNHHNLNWKTKINYLHNIAFGLELIHEAGLIHRDLHIGNILHMDLEGRNTYITDMGLCKPADNSLTKNTIYGVLSYLAPEILQYQNYTKAADIYSFGIIMYEIITGLPPYHNLNHDEALAINICLGYRPSFNNIKVPQIIVDLFKRCLDANPSNRPSAKEVHRILEISDNRELQMQINEIENESTNSIPLIAYSYSESTSISKLIKFNNLPEPRNSDASSTKYSGKKIFFFMYVYAFNNEN